MQPAIIGKMKTHTLKPVALRSLLCLVVCLQLSPGAAQTTLGLSIQMNSGQPELAISGAVGSVCQIQWSDNLSTTSRWSHLEHAVLSSSPSLLSDSTAALASTRYYRAVWTPNTNLVWIPPGNFTQGSPTNELHRGSSEGPQVAVTISKGFWMGKCEVTQGEYLAVMGSNPSYYNGDRSGPPDNDQDYGTDLTRPVELVSWHDATNYCRLRTVQERAAGRIPTNSVYRLPTEAEWEYACRAGTSTRFYFGDDPDYTNVAYYAWYYENGDLQTHSVGQLLPNSWGLYDMSGNVWEWCQDWYAAYPGGSATNPQGPATGTFRVWRGGGWFENPRYCRSARRFNHYPDYIYEGLGIRVVLTSG